MECNANVTWKGHLPVHKDFQVIYGSVALRPCVPKGHDGPADTSLVAREEIQRTVAEGRYFSVLDFLARVHTEATILRFYILGFLGKVHSVWQKCPFGLIIVSVTWAEVSQEITRLNFNGHSLPSYKISRKDGLRLQLVYPIFRPAFWRALRLTEASQLL
jgi:hypothetical protein